ncbi:16S rRNA methyltransferase [Endozoicomonas montiporae]|uniref:Ribosomal RNA small subunit methyltransferase G n=2 Tax=Endozoicomonas montiporae TaxID=1027273 RepID=A0A081N040_9GAMM|nr:16S rRNA (guanine(527)-N(7))-methyltransferase RsmG [Endozoicomonas montiporae]AMO58830.1 16S rRNA (guanine527-N7)-methyltransferase [Endozoicomonas montiporae CL-33]KEQ11813.1 16S rRNA methyltransferase [Endozoicomonas montiporae]
MSLRESICRGANTLSVSLTEEQADLLTRYVELLAKWNKAYNLTAVRDINEMVSRHILDSLSIAPYMTGDHLLDVGSGPGLPGMIMAIMYPEKQFTLLDSNGKKTRFMTQAKMELGLKNVQVENTRCESFQARQPFDVIMSRAFSSLLDMVEGTHHLLSPEGTFLAMKGLYPEEELQDLYTARSDVKETESHILSVPGCEAQRHLVMLKQIKN